MSWKDKHFKAAFDPQFIVDKLDIAHDPEHYADHGQVLLPLAVDLDNTLATTVWPDSEGIGEPIWENIRKLEQTLIITGRKAFIHTSRPWSHKPAIEKFIEQYDLPIDWIVCGKPIAWRYIDDRGQNAWEVSWT